MERAFRRARKLVRAQAGPAVFVTSGSGSSENGKTNIDFRILKLSKGDEVYLTLNHYHLHFPRRWQQHDPGGGDQPFTVEGNQQILATFRHGALAEER